MNQESNHAEELKLQQDINDRLYSAIQELSATKKGKMDFRGKLYSPVALRVEMLRKHMGTDVCVTTEIVSISDEVVVMRAVVSYQGVSIASGFAEEHRSTKGVNSTSALENCETSAIGRALACLGLVGGEYASADELSGAVSQQDALEAAKKSLASTIRTIKDGLATGQLDKASEAWFELSNEEKESIWVAPTKGGPFTAAERAAMKSKEFREAFYGVGSGLPDASSEEAA